MDRFIGKRLDGRYEISELIGMGGMAVVYKAYDNIDDRIVAIKILKEEFLANDEFRRRFKNESKAIAVLSHPNIVKVYDVSFGDILQYIVMEYINGITLKKYIEQQGVIEWKEALYFTSQILKALQHAHEKGIVHRDIKPQNIMLLPDGTIKVTDFGIARFSRSEQRTITDKAIGSVHYISPEQARGDFTDGKADIYSVGVLLYEMVTGRVPFQAESAVTVAIMQLQNEPVHPCTINSLIPKGLEEITLKAMQKEPNNRYSTALEMLNDLNLLKQDPTVTFNHEYFIDNAPTRHVELNDNNKVKEENGEKESKPPVIPILAGVAAVLVVVLTVFIFIGWKWINGTGDRIKCPDFVGKNYYELIKDKNYKDYWNNIVADEINYNNDFEAGIIYEQDPTVGSNIKTKTIIHVKISKGPLDIKLADYSNYEYSTAYDELTGEGLNVVKVELSNEEIQKGYVVSTYPPADAIVNYGDDITVYVSTGQPEVSKKVPDITGMTLADAKRELEKSGFRLEKHEVADKVIKAGIVVSQSPKGDTSAALGSAIAIYVSTGAPTTGAITENTRKDVTITVPLPSTIKSSVELSVRIDGVLQRGKTVNIDLRQVSSYDMTITGSSTKSTVMFQINGNDYLKYAVNFQTQKVTFLNVYDVSSVITTRNPTETVSP